MMKMERISLSLVLMMTVMETGGDSVIQRLSLHDHFSQVRQYYF